MWQGQIHYAVREISWINAVKNDAPHSWTMAQEARPVQSFLADRRNLRGVFQRPHKIMECIRFENIANQVAATNTDQRRNAQLARRVHGRKTRAAGIKRLYEIVAPLLRQL